MTDLEIKNNIRKLADAVISAGMMKNINDAQLLIDLVKSVEDRIDNSKTDQT